MSCGGVGPKPSVTPATTTGAVAGATGGGGHAHDVTPTSTTTSTTAGSSFDHCLQEAADGAAHGGPTQSKAGVTGGGDGAVAGAAGSAVTGVSALGGSAAQIDQLQQLMKILLELMKSVQQKRAGAVAGANGGGPVQQTSPAHGGPHQVVQQHLDLQVENAKQINEADSYAFGGGDESSADESSDELDDASQVDPSAVAGANGGSSSGSSAPGIHTLSTPSVVQTSVTSDGGRYFAERASSSMDTVGGIGTSELTAAWNGVPAGERATLRAEIEPRVHAKLAHVAQVVAGYSGDRPNDNDLMLVRKEVESARDLAVTMGFPIPKLAPEATAKLRAVLEQRVVGLEQEAERRVAAARRAGTPDHAGAQDMGIRVAQLANVFGVIEDPALKARLDRIPGTMVGAVLFTQ